MTLNQGDIVSVDFPFSDGSGVKRRPALIISTKRVNKTGDVILMQITSRQWQSNEMSFALEPHNLSEPLPLKSLLRLHKIFTLNKSLIIKRISKLNEATMREVLHQLFILLKE